MAPDATNPARGEAPRLGKLSFPGRIDNRRYPTKNTAVQEQSKARLNYLARGEGATELDALEVLGPGELRRILVKEIERFHDPDFAGEWERARIVAQDTLDENAAPILALQGDEPFAQRLAELKQQTEQLIADVAAYNDEIQEELEAAAPDPGDWEWPEPHNADDWPDPLLDCTRGYAEQIDRLKQHQDKPTCRREKIAKTFTCEQCGKPFSAINKTVARFCSARCRNHGRKEPRG
jgi:hypothetical protein